MLRVSTQVQGGEVDLKGIVEGSAVDTGVPFDDELLHFAETALGHDGEAIAVARNAVTEKMGEVAMIDVACVIANFQRMVRIADGTGIPLDAPVAMMTDDIRGDLGINDFGSADNTPSLPWWKKWLARLLKPFLPGLLRRMTKGMTEPGTT